MTVVGPSQDSPPAEARAIPIRAIVLVSVLVIVAVGIHFTPISAWLQDTEQLHRSVHALGHWTYPATVLTVAVLVAFGVPRLLFCAAGGMVLGFWPGLILTQIGTLLGYYAAFLLIRWGNRDRALHRFSKIARLAELVQGQGVLGVILLRQLPLHGTLVNLCLGLSRVKHRHFLIGSAIGILTEAIPATLIGAGLVKPSFKDSARYLVIAGIVTAVVSIACTYWIRRIRRSRAGSMLIDEAAHAEMESRPD
jgi:uncharacterized membrane protein YdjX (TVP38/TMEM64 family)